MSPSGGVRLDSYLAQYYPERSRAYWQKRCKDGGVLVNGKPEKPSFLMGEDDTVRILDTEVVSNEAEPELTTVYEDSDVIVFDKPPGMLTHSKGAFNPETTVATFVQSYFPVDKSGRAGIVHRLDRGTSGVIICAKNDNARRHLQRQFAERKVSKTYFAVVEGEPDKKELMMKWPIGRDPRRPQSFRVHASGKPAETKLMLVKKGKRSSLVKLLPKTGRTHQLRVHLARLGCPIVGDELYGGPVHSRILLHAAKLELVLPSGQRKSFESPLPREFTRAVEEA